MKIVTVLLHVQNLLEEQKLLNDITESLIKNTKFDLPKEFLIKWLQNSGEKPLTEEEAREEYEKSEKGIRYQLIEGAIIKEQNLQIKFIVDVIF